jgi:hypothetical protein
MINQLLMSVDYLQYNDGIREINNSTCYSKFDNCCCIHNLNFKSAENVMKDLEKGAWILWIYKNKYINKKLQAITIKMDNGLVHHKEFLYGLTFNDFQVCEIDVDMTYYKKDTLVIRKTYKSLRDFLEKLNEIYGLEIDKQVIYEDDNDFI